MKDRKKREDRENREFAALMQQYSHEFGEYLVRENERLKEDPNAAVPQEVNERMLEVIRKTLKEQQSG